MSQLIKLYENHPAHQQLDQLLKKQHLAHVKGMQTSALSFFLASNKYLAQQPLIVVMDNEEDSAYTYNDLQCTELRRPVFFYPNSHKKSALKSANDDASMSQESILSKTEVLDKISKLDNYVLVTYPDSLGENVIQASELSDNTLQLHTGEKVDSNIITDVLDKYGFEYVDFVCEPGQYSTRGSIVDIYSYSNEEPYRIDFFGDEIDSIRTFDVVNQLSIEKVERITIIPNICRDESEKPKIPFLDFVSDKAVVWFNDMEYDLRLARENNPDPDKLMESVDAHQVVDCGITGNYDSGNCVKFNVIAQPVFKKNFRMLAENIHEYQQLGYTTYIAVTNNHQEIRLHDIFSSEAVDKKVDFKSAQMSINKGFIDSDLNLCVYTDHQIFERYLKYRLKEAKIKRNRDAMTINEMNSLKPGDFVVHQDHGIGTFDGLQTMDINGKPQEVIRLVYKDNDILFVSIHALHKISKYKGGDGEAPKIYKLGSGAWNKLKQKTKAKVKDIAEKLIRLYAQRKQQKGYAYQPDSYMQQALEASFIYEDTPDQEKATAAVKADMESNEPMDRLICGDVGFGKTEIAVRAAFKAACDGKQVAVLVPTTILALQHYKTFSDRLKEFPVNVEYMSRLRTAKEIKNVEKSIADGTTDIVIGTHKLVGKGISFKDLGLLIIDEEQKFGVSVKEKLKQMKLNVDTLTLSATPIPRTLQFSLLGARDLSIINTPPANRYPVVTEVHTFNIDVVREAIDYELSRHGQVFIIQNKIKRIYETEALVRKLFPDATILTGHGQMDGNILEDIMLSFINNEADVLISTTIIENGLDIPNANTIIVLDAQNFGLSELHQLRGRVGRSNKKAFCYLLAPPEEHLTIQARQRLKAIESFSELGSGFNIAMQDLDIRGAGNLLGGEQSGFITEIGIETYQKILDEALKEIKEEEYMSQYNEPAGGEAKSVDLPRDYKFVSDCQIDTDMEVLLPSDYVQNVAERVKIYRALDNLKDLNELKAISGRLEDRFGKIPKQTLSLFNVVKMRWMAQELGIEKITLKNNKMLCYFVSDANSPYFNSQVFGNVLMRIQRNRDCQMKQINGKAGMVIDKITSTDKALTFLESLKKSD
ncbi:MAG: transcription-repair coupling factor [Bacteroidales bacterium]|nr:transcription-repair coupling factor [Bacteroidales bacterium]